MSVNGDRSNFTSSTGLSVKLRPVSPFSIEKVKESVKDPLVPTYTVTTAVGAVETYPHDEESIKAASAEDQQAWARYQVDLLMAMGTRNERLTQLLLLEGVDVDIPADGWQKRQQRLGIVIPDDPDDLKVHYILTRVVGRPEDLEEMLARVMEQIGVQAADMEAARNSFRHSIRRNAAPATNGAGAIPLDT